MSAILTILRHEFITVVRRRSFMVLVVGLPLLAGLVVTFLNLTAPSQEDIVRLALPEAPSAPQGYVDLAGIVKAIPDPLAGSYVAFPSLEEARRAEAAGRISGFFVVPQDFITSGQVAFYSRDFNPLAAEGRAAPFRFVLLSNLTDDLALTSLLWEPVRLQEVALEAKQDEGSSDVVSYWLPYGMIMLLFMSLTFSSGWLLQSVANEKDTRMMEVMLSSVSPVQMLAGKTLGLGAAGLLQLVIWLATASLLLTLGGRGLSIPEGFELGLDTLAWGLVLFILGYLVYASLIAGLGALAPSLKDASQATFLVYLPMILPLWFINSIVNQPNGALAVVLSLVPFTAPVAMIARLVRVSPPAWQLALAVVLLLATAYLAVQGVARLFQAQTLLSGQSLSLAGVRRALRAR
ncbi:MAG: ABC transporter permease [Anaerolineae bacterium]|nr:ABC transporter permease [Anaerolineae bacterium]